MLKRFPAAAVRFCSTVFVMVGGLLALFATPAMANSVTATVVPSCSSYTITIDVTGFNNSENFLINWTISGLGTTTITGTDSIIGNGINPSDYTIGPETIVVGPLVGTDTPSGTITVTDLSTGITNLPVPISFSPTSITCAGQSQLTVVKTADSATITPGSTAGFTVTISNTGSAAAPGVMLSDPLPAGAGSDINWTIDTTTGNPTSFMIIGPVGGQVLALNPSGITLNAGASLTVHITGMTSLNDATGSSNPALNVGGVSGYTVLYEGTGGHNLQITNVSVGGNIGVGGTGHVQFNGPGTIGGRLDFSAAKTGQYSNNNGSNVGPTSVNYNVSAVTTALNDIGNLSASLSGLSGTHLTFNNASQTVNENSGTLQTTGGVTYRVFNVTSYSENNGDVVTINGDGSGDPVVFNFSSNSNVNLGGDIVLTGGLTPDQVVWNFASSNQNIQLNNNASSYPYPTYAYQGVILAPNDKVSVVNASLIGRVWGGDNGDMQIVSGDNIHTPPGIGTLVNTATVNATNVSSLDATATININ